VVDFYAPSIRLAVEVGERSQDGRGREDDHRERTIERAGVAVIHVTNDSVIRDPDGVAAEIAREVERRKGPASTLAPGDVAEGPA